MIVYNQKELDTPTLMEILERKLVQNVRIMHLLNYYAGNQQILLRYYSDPNKPNNRIVVNYCKNVTDFLTAYLVGIPIKYEGADEAFGKVLDFNDDPQSVQTAVEYMNITGFGCELFYTDEDGNPRYSPLNPLECIFIMDDDLQRDLTAFIRIVKDDKNDGFYDVTVYTSADYQTFRLDDGEGSLTPTSGKIPHYWGDVPVNIYENNEILQGSFEQAIPMQDALNKIYSDNVNDFEQFVDAYLVLEGMAGTTPEDIEAMKTQRVLLPPPDSKAYWLTKSVDKSHIKQLQDDLRAQILEMCNCPDIKEFSGQYGDISGTALRLKLIKTEIAATQQENSVKKAALRKAELLHNILTLETPSLSYTGIKPVFTRNFLMVDATNEPKPPKTEEVTENE